MEGPGFEVEQNTLGGDFGGEASDSDDSSYKDYESGTSYSDSFDSNGDRIDEPEVELVGEMIQKELDHLLGLSFWGLKDYFDSNSDDDLNNDVDYDKYGNKKYPLFNPQTDMRNPILIKGLPFPSRNILKYAIKQYGRINRVVTKLTRNDKLRVKAVCVPSCPWTLWASKLNPKDPIDGSWQIKILVNHHKCGKRDLEIDNSYNICFMSDKQKGSIEAISLLFPNGESRNCARHLYNNFKNMEGFKGQGLRLTYWKAAKVTFPRQFEEAMSEMRSLSESAEAWLRDKDLRTWSRAHFSTRCKSDLLLNNNNECFNKDLLSLQIVLEARDKPILTMLEIIRRKVMTRLVFMREAAEKYPGPLCPRIQNKLSEIVSQSNNIWPIYAGNEKYEVDCGLGNKHVVDLLNSSCSCRKWDLSGIPCKHVVSCMQLLVVSPETYVNTCYTVTTQLNIYSYLINPIKGPMQWEHVRDMEPILPTIIRRSPRRPKQTRRKEVDEVRKSGPKLSKTGQQANCTKFGKPSHNTRTCKGIVWGNQMPFVVGYKFGSIGVAHNGNLVN
ncbi:uncharacterized protein [Gossypium hirsutum]|uniref:SWIM-type domain-containing protein n=2 Tax=Gossypium TaxID=3633 RepID=A0A1U8P9X3_GOSHI|nr:uncharacterized protein LOC107955760 [Gossypium hirsutum]